MLNSFWPDVSANIRNLKPVRLGFRTGREAVHNKTCPCNTQEIFLASKMENFQLKNSDIFLIFAQNIDCGFTLEPPRRGSSNEYPQSMFWSKNKRRF